MGLSFELDCFVRRFEGRQVAVLKLVGDPHSACAHGDPEDGVSGWRLIAPALPFLQSHCEVVDWRRGVDGTRRRPIAAEKYARRAVMLNSLGTLVEAHRWAEFELGRQGDPKLKAARPCRLAGTAAMPHAAAGLHPLDAAGGQHTRCAVRVLIAHVALGEVCEGRDARMRVKREALGGASIVVEEIEENERLQEAAEIGWAHQTGDVSISGTTGAPHDLTHGANPQPKERRGAPSS